MTDTAPAPGDAALDGGTSAFYTAYAARLQPGTESPRSAMLPLAQAALRPGDWVLDVGAGAGRDVAALCELGLQAWGVEPSAAMRATASRLFPTLGNRLREGALPDLGQPFADVRPEGFDAVICSAVLMHVSPDDLPRALAALVAPLRPAGTDGAAPALLLSVPEMAASRLQADRDDEGRRFHNHAPDRLQALLAPLGLVPERWQVNDAVLASTQTRWHMAVFRRLG